MTLEYALILLKIQRNALCHRLGQINNENDNVRNDIENQLIDDAIENFVLMLKIRLTYRGPYKAIK